MEFSEEEEEQRVLPFQLQFDKPIASQVKIAEWNPEKDLLAMVTDDSSLLLHRFNWQRLWTVSPGKSITSICWRPDGKSIAVGLEDGTISLHDVENGKQLRSIKSHDVAVMCLNWEEDMDGKENENENGNFSNYSDRTSRFFPPPPRIPRMPGVISGDNGFIDDNEYSIHELSNSTHQRFNVLTSGDKNGNISFCIFGIFPIGKINIHNLPCRLLEASIYKVTLSKDLCNLIVLCSGKLSGDNYLHSFHCLVLDTSIFWKSKNELHQVAQQASSIDDLSDVINTSLSVMSKQWSDAMRIYTDKFNLLPNLISDYGMNITPQEEFLSLLGGARTSPPLRQFLANTLGESGVKRMTKVVCGAGKELQLIILNHLKPAVEIIGFRMGELRGLSRWRARFSKIGLDEKLVDNATEKAGMLLVQVERFLGILSSVVQQYSNFFVWLLKSVKIMMSEPSDQLLPFSSELVIIFLKFLYDQDPVKQLLEFTEDDYSKIVIDSETMQRIKELVQFGGFSDTMFLKRTLAKEYQQMESCFKEVFKKPFATVSKKITFKSLFPLFPISTSPDICASVSYYKEDSDSISRLMDYVLFKIPDESFSNIKNCIGIVKKLVKSSLEAVLLCIPDGYNCVDLSLYKEGQIVLLLNEKVTSSESLGNACMMIIQTCDLPFLPISKSNNLNSWNIQELKDSLVYLQMENEKVRSIPHDVISPLAVSASRGVACVFAAKKRALVYILEEDEDEISDSE